MRRLATIIAASFAVIGCASQPITVREVETVEVVRTEIVRVPEFLLVPCEPFLPEEGWTNEDLEAGYAANVVELLRCTQDKEAIRELR